MAAALLLVPPAVAMAGSTGAPSPGAAGIGDRLFPTLGNGGYDVLHYDVDLRYATADPRTPMTGTVTLVARATQSLSSFNLDFGGDAVGAVTVNGKPATAVREAEELVITPKRPLHKGSRFKVRVADFAATPTAVDPDVGSSTAFFYTPDGSATAPQPNFAHLFLPSNDHPRDKASFSFEIDVPEGTAAFANGVPVSQRTEGGRTVYGYLERHPLATELLQIAVGNFEVTSPGEYPGVLMRDVTPPRLTAQLRPALDTQLAHMAWMEERVGRYPFDAYGSLVVDDIPFALETQTLSIYGVFWFRDLPRGVWEPVMIHELSHHWIGNSVSPWEWSDLWVNEGHATWYEIHYAEEHGQLAELTAGQLNEEGYADIESYMRAIYAAGDAWRAEFGPVGLQRGGEIEQFFTPNQYQGGALVLYALRQVIGREAFDRLEREWVRRYQYGVASTADFIRLASEIAGRDLEPFLTAWVYGEQTPPMPGHPDWTVDPVPTEAPAPAGA